MPKCYIRKDLQEEGLACPFMNEDGFVEPDDTLYEYVSLDATKKTDDELYILHEGRWKEVYNIDFDFIN